MRRTLILGALTGIALALMTLNVSALETYDAWAECQAASDPGCATGGDDTITWAEHRGTVLGAYAAAKDRLYWQSLTQGNDPRWISAPRQGFWLVNCADYVITIRRWMIEAGLPPDALRPMSVRIGDGYRHLVLVVFTSDNGAIVLDSLNQRGSRRIYNESLADYIDYRGGLETKPRLWTPDGWVSGAQAWRIITIDGWTPLPKREGL